MIVAENLEDIDHGLARIFSSGAFACNDCKQPVECGLELGARGKCFGQVHLCFVVSGLRYRSGLEFGDVVSCRLAEAGSSLEPFDICIWHQLSKNDESFFDVSTVDQESSEARTCLLMI